MKTIGPLKITETSEHFFDTVKREGADPEAFAGMLLEIAVQMVRNGYLKWNGHGFECKTEKGEFKAEIKNLK